MEPKTLSNKTGLALSSIYNIINARRRPSWAVAKRLAEVTGTSPELWLEGQPDQIRGALNEAGSPE